ncbi:MAG: tetratricopeptide repeat protein [Pirellulaceae bacterium]
MQLDPTKWFVAFAGFIYDWILTREWTKALLGLLPIALVTGLVGCSWYGRTLDRRELASWYMMLGEEEIKEWEAAWSGESESGATEESATGGSDLQDATPSAGKITPFADMLFRRVENLVPSEQSQFYIAVSLAQQGAKDEALKLLSKIAPDDTSGNPQAHAFVALLRMPELSKVNSPTLAPLIRHHVIEGAKGRSVPLALMTNGSFFLQQTARRQPNVALRKYDERIALDLLNKAAEIKPALKLALANLARRCENSLVFNDAIKDAEEYYEAELELDPDNDKLLVAYAETIAKQKRLDEAEKLLKERFTVSPSPELKTALSNLYLGRYRVLVSEKKGNVAAGDMRYLNVALQYDPGNARVGEEIAKLVKVNNKAASQQLVNKLKEFLASGTATIVTHRLIAEAYITRNSFEAAIPHLKQVVTRLPDPSCLNNLAFIYGELYPEKIDEAVKYSNGAIKVAASQGSSRADYFDTLGTLLAKKKDHAAAITAFETAIEREPDRVDFRERVAEQYAAIGDEIMVQSQKKMIAKLKEAIAANELREKTGISVPMQPEGDPNNVSIPAVTTEPPAEANESNPDVETSKL